MYKTINRFIGAALIAAALPTLAVAQDNQFDGLYAGAGVGYAWQEVSKDYLTSVKIAGIKRSRENSVNDDQNLGLGQIFIGYGLSRGMLYFGTELGLNVYKDNSSAERVYPNQNLAVGLTPKVVTFDVTPKYGFQLSFLPGLYLTPSTLVYGRLGGALTRYDTEAKFNVNRAVSPEAYDTKNSDDNWVPELVVGAGVRQKIWESLSARLDYTYTYSDQFSGAPNTLGLPANDSRYYKVHNDSTRVKANNLALSIIYSF